MSIKNFLRWYVPLFVFLVATIWPGRSFAFPGDIVTGYFPIADGPGGPIGCNNSGGCHGSPGVGLAQFPTLIGVSVNGGGFGAFPAGFAVATSSTTSFSVKFHPGPTTPNPMGGFLVFHNPNLDASGNDSHGLLIPGASADSCKGTAAACNCAVGGAGACGGGGTSPAASPNTEVMHSTPHAHDGAGDVTVDFSYQANASCGVFPFRLWMNGVNGDGLCTLPDAAIMRDFTITSTCSPSSPACTNSVTLQPAAVCSTAAVGIAGTCSTPATVRCNGLCTAGACTNNCNNDADCTSGSFCNAAGHCVAQVTPSNPCNLTTDCRTPGTCAECSAAAPNCVDGVCCTGACGGSNPNDCQSCNAIGHVGTCFIATGGTCAASSCIGSTFQPAGTCDGVSTACQVPGPFTCNDGNACTSPDQCSAGACVSGPPVACPAPDQCHQAVSCIPASGCPALPNQPNGTLCGAVGFCVGNVFHPHQACTTGVCGSPVTTTCNGTCDPVTGCGGCNTDGDCLAGNYCDNTGTCVAFKIMGTCNLAAGTSGGDCKTAGCHECSTNNCIDGFCCNTACGNGSTTDCVACNVGGSTGICSPITAGTGCNADSNLCTQNDACNAGGTCVPGAAVVCAAPQACQAAGVCNPASGTCTFALLTGTVCAAATCQADAITLLQASLCTGASPTCPAQVPTNCFPNPCSGGACTTGCTADTNCAAGAYCNGTACQAKKPNSTMCGLDHECQFGHCVDGVCCDAACNGQCQACDAAGSVGTCTTVGGTPHGARPQCSNDGTGCGGTCDGVTAAGCIYPDSAKSCRAQSCDAATNIATLPAGCNGAGACPVLQTVSCGNFVCGATQCNGDCMGDDSKCTATSFCAAGICQPKRQNGDMCGMPHECSTNFCTDGVCCSADCKSQCQACDVTGSTGTCTTVTSGPPHGGRLRCDGVGVCQASCDGTSATACAFPGATKLCGPPSCTAGTEIQIATCNGVGACSTPKQQDCTPYACGVTSCRTACASPLDCARGFECIASICVSADATAPLPEAAAPESGTDGQTTVSDASVVVADAATLDVSAGDVLSPADAGAAGPDAGLGDGALPIAPEFEGGSCACRAAGSDAGRPRSALLPLLGLALAAARRPIRRRRVGCSEDCRRKV